MYFKYHDMIFLSYYHTSRFVYIVVIWLRDQNISGLPLSAMERVRSRLNCSKL